MKYYFLSFLIIFCFASFSQSETGCISGDCKKGEGTYRFWNGIYKGSFKGKKPHGKGVMEYENGNRYEGEFKRGEIEGYGTMKYANGDYYRGEWKDGKYHGLGSLMAPNDKTKKFGVWKNGVLVDNRIHALVETAVWKPEEEKKEVEVKEEEKKNEKKDQDKKLEDATYNYALKKANYEADKNAEGLTMTSDDCTLLKKMTSGIDKNFAGLYRTETERPHPQLGSHYKVYDASDKLFNMEGTYTACELISDYDMFFKMKDVTEEEYTKLIDFIASCLGSGWVKNDKGYEVIFTNGNKIVKVKDKYLGNLYYEVFLWIQEK